MRVFISYSLQDTDVVTRIVNSIKQDGHEVFVDCLQTKSGDNIQQKVAESLAQADALVIMVSENSFKSPWVQREVTAIALHDISKRECRVIPVRIDKSPLPSYLADRAYLDLTKDFEGGLRRLRQALAVPTTERAQNTILSASAADNRASQLANLRQALRRGRLTLVCGAGASIEAGIPAWNDLLLILLERMMERIAKDRSLDLGKRAAREFQLRHGASSLILGKYLKNTLGKDFSSEMRDALYMGSPGTSE